jgi:nitrite reductase (NO-forming)
VGVRQQLWTFNGTAPGPTLRGRVGDRFVVTLTNDTQQGHGVDFHAGSLAPDEPMRTIGPGESHTFSFTATRSGIWMYHCSAMPMSLHIANGMFGAVVIDPPGLPSVDREYLLVQSELYLGPQDASADPDKVRAERPDAVVFNGFANQYDDDQLPVRVGERVRIWVLDAGPNRATSFHVVGGQFDVVFSEGGYLIGAPGAGGTAQGRAASSASPAPSGGAQALALQPAQGGFVELTPPQVGHYPFVSHVMVDAERGAHGVLRVVP